MSWWTMDDGSSASPVLLLSLLSSFLLISVCIYLVRVLRNRTFEQREEADRLHAARWSPGVPYPFPSHVPSSEEVLRSARCYADLLKLRAQSSPDVVAHWQRGDSQSNNHSNNTRGGGGWRKITFGEFFDSARSIAGALVSGSQSQASGPGSPVVSKGETVAVAGPTRSEWLQISMGVQLAGAVTVGVYPKQSAQSLEYLLSHSQARWFFVADKEDIQTTLTSKRSGKLPHLVVVVTWSDHLCDQYAAAGESCGLDVLSLSAILKHAPLSETEGKARSPDIDDTAVLVYTSGTTGNPKGAMVTHRNILVACEVALDRIKASGEPSDASAGHLSVNYLPLAHVFEQIILGAHRMAFGLTCVFNTSIASLIDELAEVKPNGMAGVPRMFEKMHVKIMGSKESLTGAKLVIFKWAEGVAREVAAYRLANNGQHSNAPLPFVLGLKNSVAGALVFNKIRAVFGGRVKSFATGAAPISPDILTFFWGVGIPIFEGWGMTEIPAPAITNRHGKVKLGTIGTPASNVHFKLAKADSEILVRGPAVFKGYFRDEAQTRATFVEDEEGKWLATGDIGTVDEDGFVKIVDRKKHIIITAGGKNLAPANIEKAIKSESPLISNLHIHGDRRPYVTALICPSPVETLELGQRLHVISQADLEVQLKHLAVDPTSRSPELNALTERVTGAEAFRDLVLAAVKRGNAKLVHVEKVRRFIILSRDFSIEGGELTPTMKMKRREIEHQYQKELDRIYSDPDFGIEAEGVAGDG